jgi:threonine aldolase
LAVVEGLEAAGFVFYRWEGTTIRLVTSFATTQAAVDTFIDQALALAGAARRSA